MGGSKKPKTPPPPKAAPPPAAEDVSEVIAPTLQQEAARRARRGAYTTRGQKMGAGGQVLGASPIQLADVATASGIYQTPDEKKKTIDEFRTLRRRGRGRGGRRHMYSKISEMVTRKRDYDKYLKARERRIAARKERAETARTQGGMTI